MKMRLLFFTSILLLVKFYHCFGQDENDYNRFIPPATLTPEVAALHSFIDVPVGYFTGTVDFSIPLAKIDVPGLTIPVTLQYNSLGIKVDQVASSVGAGWVLQVGGMISQNIIGYKDFDNIKGYVKIDDSKLPKPFYGFESLGYDRLLEISGAYNTPDAPHYDADPDIYYYSYPGGSGKFVYDRFGKINLIPKKPIHIVPPDSGGYKIIDEKGIIYSYESGGASISIYETLNPRPWDVRILPNKNNTYYLSKIELPSGFSISFDYEFEGYEYSFGMMTKTKKKFSSNCGPAYFQPEQGTNYITSATKRIKRIYSNSGQKIEFIYNNKARLDAPPALGGDTLRGLTNVVVFFNEDTIRKINLDYDYFDSRDPGADIYKNKRLRLLKVYVTGQPGYEFSYYNSDQTSKLNSYSQDIYGYNNGANNSSLVLPFPDETDGANRNANLTYLKAGTLQRVVYPTGGWSEFEYELNVGSTDNHYIGGLRIKSIKEFDSNENEIKSRYFEYLKPGTNESSGIENSKPYYVQDLYRFTKIQSTDPTCDHCSYEVYQSSSHTSANISGVAGGNGFYQFVTELIGQNGSGGKTTYEFTVHTDIGNSSRVPGTPEIDYSWARGQILSITKFVSTNNNYYPITKEIYNYHWDHDFNSTLDTPTHSNENFIGGCKVEIVYPECIIVVSGIPSIFPALLHQTGYTHISTWFNLESKETRIYKPLTEIINVDNPNYFTSEIQSYEFSKDKLILKNLTKNTSDNQSIQVSFKYPFDYTIPTDTSDNMVLSLKKMNEKHMLSIPIEVIKKKNSNIIDGRLTLYKTDQFHHISPSEGKSMNLRYPILYDTTLLSKINQINQFSYNNYYKTELLFSDYDSLTNLLSYRKASDVCVSYIWDYLNNYRIAETINATSNEIYFTSYEFNPVVQGEDPYTLDYSFAHTGKVSLKSEKATSGEYVYFTPFLDINNSTQKKYKYSGWIYSNGPSADLFFFMKPNTDNGLYSTGWQATNVTTSTTGKWVYLEGEVTVPANMRRLYLRVDNNGGGIVWFDDLRLYPSDAQMTTFTYAPLIGMTSKTDPNNITIFYEYDLFGRLVRIKDNNGNIIKHFEYHYKGF